MVGCLLFAADGGASPPNMSFAILPSWQRMQIIVPSPGSVRRSSRSRTASPNARLKSTDGFHSGASMGKSSRFSAWQAMHESPPVHSSLLKSCLEPFKPGIDWDSVATTARGTAAPKSSSRNRRTDPIDQGAAGFSLRDC